MDTLQVFNYLEGAQESAVFYDGLKPVRCVHIGRRQIKEIEQRLQLIADNSRPMKPGVDGEINGIPFKVDDTLDGLELECWADLRLVNWLQRVVKDTGLAYRLVEP